MTMQAWQCGCFPCQCGNCRSDSDATVKPSYQGLQSELAKTKTLLEKAEGALKRSYDQAWKALGKSNGHKCEATIALDAIKQRHKKVLAEIREGKS